MFNNDERFSILIRVVSDFGGEKEKELDILDQYSYKEVLREHINYARNIGLIVENDSIVNPFASICYAALKNSYIFRSNGRVVKWIVNTKLNNFFKGVLTVLNWR